MATSDFSGNLRTGAEHAQPSTRAPGIAASSLLPIGGYVGITCGVTAWYVAFAHVTNATFGRELIPTWPLN